jgi:polyphenol oxidase
MTVAVGSAFTGPADGDMRGDPASRRAVSDRLGIASDWATVTQVHGGEAVRVERPGTAGEADGMVTTRPNLPLAVFTADCLGVVLTGPASVGVVHAGWRGLAAGILEATIGLMEQVDGSPRVATLGPSIGPCCFEVGDEVAALFPADVAATSWGTTSVDLAGAAARVLTGIELSRDGRCTACGGGFSHRASGTEARLATLGWLR